jgi:hypothetical protein
MSNQDKRGRGSGDSSDWAERRGQKKPPNAPQPPRVKDIPKPPPVAPKKEEGKEEA